MMLYPFNLSALLLAAFPTVNCADAPPAVRSRTFRFTYAAVVTGLEPNQSARVWLPVAPSNDDQDAAILSKELPADGEIGRDADYGNDFLYLEAKADSEGRIPLKIIYKVTRREVKGDGGKDAKESREQLARYLKPDAKVPVDGKPLELLRGKDLPKDQIAAARVIYDLIDDELKYGKDKPGWGQGDSVWACDSRTGNCTDFHSLFLSLARSRGIPDKFEIGFPLPDEHGAGDVSGYHCWAKFRPEGRGWIPVDISEANQRPEMRDYNFGNLTENRVVFTTGRDLTLVPRQAGGPANFLVYPYVEVNGKVWPQDKIEKKFSYQDE